MSLQISLDEPRVIVTQPEVTKTITEIVISRIIDLPGEKKVIAVVDSERIELSELSDDNYDNPREWTNLDVVEAVKRHFRVP
jgi:hypothetical protein